MTEVPPTRGTYHRAVDVARFGDRVATNPQVVLTGPDALDTEPDGDGTGDADPEPTVWFFIETDDGDQPDDLDAQLLRIPGVTAAYVTPDQGPP